MFCAKATMLPTPGMPIWYCVLTPENETSLTRPGPSMFTPAFSAGSFECTVSFSGRTPIVTSPVWRWAREVGVLILRPATSTTMVSPAEAVTGPLNRFDCPRKFATNAVVGSS